MKIIDLGAWEADYKAQGGTVLALKCKVCGAGDSIMLIRNLIKNDHPLTAQQTARRPGQPGSQMLKT